MEAVSGIMKQFWNDNSQRGVTMLSIIAVILLAWLVGWVGYLGYAAFFAQAPGEPARVAMRRGLPHDARDQRKVKRSFIGKYNVACIIPSMNVNVERLMEGFETTLTEKGIKEPVLRIYDANFDRIKMQGQVEDAIDSKPDIIFACRSMAAQLTQQATAKLESDERPPVVFADTGDPIKLGLIANAKNSGNNMTGAALLGTSWVNRMVNLIPAMMPKVKKVLIPYDPTQLGGALEAYHEVFVQAFKRNNIEVQSLKLFKSNEVLEKVTPFVTDDVDLILILPDATLVEAADVIIKLGEKHKIPTMSATNISLIEKGMCFAFGYREYDVGVAAANQILRVIDEGMQPNEIPLDPLDTVQRFRVNVDALKSQGILDCVDSNVLYLIENGEFVDA